MDVLLPRRQDLLRSCWLPPFLNVADEAPAYQLELMVSKKAGIVATVGNIPKWALTEDMGLL